MKLHFSRFRRALKVHHAKCEWEISLCCSFIKIYTPSQLLSNVHTLLAGNKRGDKNSLNYLPCMLMNAHDGVEYNKQDNERRGEEGR